MVFRGFLIISVCIFISSCRSGVVFDIASQTQTFNQGSGTFSNALDILWVIDNSGSMAPHQNNMVTNFSSVLNIFQNKGYDFRMAVTTSDAYRGGSYALFRDGAGSSHSGVFVITPQIPNIQSVFATNALQGTSGSGDERAFSSIRAALSNPANPAFIRPNAFLSIIILSEEDDFSGSGRAEGGGIDHDYNAATLDSVQSYVDYLDAFTNSSPTFRRYNVNTIAVTDLACLNQVQGQGSILGLRYMELSQRTNGVTGSICDISFANSLSAIASKIITLSTQFTLKKIPKLETVVIRVNNIIIPQNDQNGWTYNATANSILFHGSAVPSEGAKISVSFTPVSI